MRRCDFQHKINYQISNCQHTDKIIPQHKKQHTIVNKISKRIFTK